MVAFPNGILCSLPNKYYRKRFYMLTFLYFLYMLTPNILFLSLSISLSETIAPKRINDLYIYIHPTRSILIYIK